jgi:hypothetical protein
LKHIPLTRHTGLSWKEDVMPPGLLRWSIIAILSALLLSGCGAALHSKPGTTTTVLLIRHAERDDYGHLTTRGHARARALVDVVANTGIQVIYSPNLERNLDTVKPLADRIGVEITLTPKISLPVVGEICREILTVHAGKVVLWVGNVSGNLQAIYRQLGGKGTGPLEYGQLFILTIPDKGPTQVETLSFDI